MPFCTVDEALVHIRAGGILIAVGDRLRENQGVFIMGAKKVTPEAVNFMVKHGRGLLCLPMEVERLERLGLKPMVGAATQARDAAFTVSIDLREPPGKTGISALDRARCIQEAAATDIDPTRFRTPGHVFPLVAHQGGVLEQPGYTEAAVDLARMAGLTPAGVLCHIMSADGRMARLPELLKVARTHNLPLISIDELISYRLRNECQVRRVAEAQIPLLHASFKVIGYRSFHDRHHLALVSGQPAGKDGVLVRIHFECLAGDIFGSLCCDCGEQLQQALNLIAQEEGVFVYVRGHEEDGLRMMHKLQSHALQHSNSKSASLKTRRHLPPINNAIAASVLADLNVRSVRLLTNNPAKRVGLESCGVRVIETLRLEALLAEEAL